MNRIRSRIAAVKPASVLAWLAVFTVLALIAALAHRGPRRVEPKIEELPPRLVRVQTIEPRTVRETVTLPGRVLANIGATLSVEKPGRVVELGADKGDSVTAGQVLLRLDDRHWRALGRQAQIELEDAERDQARWERMKAQGAVATAEFDAIRSRRELAAVALEQAEAHLDQCLVRSPFDGVVEARLAESGEYLAEGVAVFRVLSLAPLKVHVNIPERDVAAVRIGDLKPIAAPSLGGLGLRMEGRAVFVAQEASPSSFTYAVELDVDAPPPGLRPGMIVDVEIQRSMREGAIAVPLAAVIPRRGEHVVFVLRDGVAVRRLVGLETVAGQEALLAFGLEAGETLIVEGHRGLQDGVPVQVAAEGTP